jgi:Flp pilus assembly pilin Flp
MKKSMNKGLVRGAAMVEYALLLFGVLIVAAAAVKTLGPKVTEAASKGAAELAGPSQ